MASEPQTDPIHSRRLTSDEDFWRVRQLLTDTYPIVPFGFNWNVRRLDGSRFYSDDPHRNPLVETAFQLWLTPDDRLVACALPEGSGNVHLQVHPDYRHLEPEMIAWAEVNLAAPDSQGRQTITLDVYEYDAYRQQILTALGYEKMTYGGMSRHMRLGPRPLPVPEIADGYQLRGTRADDLDDCQKVADLLNAAFGRTGHTAAEYQNFARRAPSFYPDLDFVAVAPDGTFAAYVGLPYDPVNRLGIFEPVCTHPEHRRRGLARSLMREGLGALSSAGAVHVLVDTGDMTAANALYTAMGFGEAYRFRSWRKVLD